MHRIEETLQRGICIGCGACSVATDGVIPIRLGASGIYTADISSTPEAQLRDASKVCPFSDESQSEDSLGAPSLAQEFTKSNSEVGSYSASFVARVADESYVINSSSGGITSWLIGQLSQHDMIDAFISVDASEASENLFDYSIKDGDAFAAARKSVYYATTLDQAVSIAKRSDKRYALVGVPCFIKAARLLCERDPVLKQRLCFFIGLVCGHMKTQNFGPSLAWQVGIAPADLKAVDFRVKDPERPSSSYSFAAKAFDGHFVSSPNQELVGANWGHGAFQPEACNFCDDVFAETADVALGDAWLPQYTEDWRGHNVIVSRNTTVDAIIRAGIETSSLLGDEVDITLPIESQLGNFRHRREGLAVRLADDIEAGLSVPMKRVGPDRSVVGFRRRMLIRKRREMSRISIDAYNQALAEDDLSCYLDAMRKQIRKYKIIESSSLSYWRRRVTRRLGTLRRKLTVVMSRKSL